MITAGELVLHRPSAPAGAWCSVSALVVGLPDGAEVPLFSWCFSPRSLPSLVNAAASEAPERAGARGVRRVLDDVYATTPTGDPLAAAELWQCQD